MSICKILILRSVWVFLVVRSVQGSDDFWEGSGTPGMAGEQNGSMAGSGFFRISTTGNGVVKKVRACAPEAA